MATTPSAAQIAARKTFADMARSGAFKKGATKRKTNPAPKRAAPKRDSGAEIIGRQIAWLVGQGWTFAQAQAMALRLYGAKPTPATLKKAQALAREALNYPDPLRVTKRGVVRTNPVKRVAPPKRKTNPAHSAPTSYAVHRALASGEPGALLGKFPTLAAAKEYAQAYATAHKCAVGIVGKK